MSLAVEPKPCGCREGECTCDTRSPQLGPGSAVGAETRRAAERATGADLGGVTVHTGPDAVDLTTRHRARALTVDDRIAIPAARDHPGSLTADALLAHELAHVAQQRNRHRAPTGDGPALEADANRSGSAILGAMRGEAPGSVGLGRPSLGAPAGLHRFDDGDDPVAGVAGVAGAAGETATCPSYEPGEVRESRRRPMVVAGVGDSGGMLVAGFAVGSAEVKGGLTDDPAFARFIAQMQANPHLQFRIRGFSDCTGDEAVNTSLRQQRAAAIRAALPGDVVGQLTETGPAPTGTYITGNGSSDDRMYNRSGFVEQVAAVYDFEPMEIPAPAPSHLYGVTSPASAYYVRLAPVNGEIIGKLALTEMRVKVIGESGADVENLWLQIELTPADMATIQATYAAEMTSEPARLPALRDEQRQLRQHIANLRSRPGMAFEVRPAITRAEERLAPIEADIDKITAHQGRQSSPYTGLTGWVSAAALGVTAIHYDTFLDLVDQFDALYASEPLRDRLTRLRQFGEDKTLKGDVVVGRGDDLSDIVTQSDRVNDPNRWELFMEGKQVRMPDGSFLDLHHFVLGLDALALPASQMSSNREVTHYGVFEVDVGESFSAATWSGDVGGAVGDFVHHKSGVWEAANPGSRADRLRFYFETRAPEMDLLADIDAWGRFGSLPKTRTDPTTFTSLRQVIEAQYGPSGQTADEYEAAVEPGRRDGLATFLCFYGFTSPTGLIGQTTARARVEDQVFIFSQAWYRAKGGTATQMGVPFTSPDAELRTASGEMTDIYLEWLEGLATRVRLGSLPCAGSD